MTVNCPDDSIDISRFAMCSNAEPTTCFDASKAQIFTGRWGLSRHLLKTSDNRAMSPNAPCMNRAKGPRSLHSPFSAPDLDSLPDVEFAEDAEVMAAIAAD